MLMNMFFYSLFLVLIATFLGIPGAYLLAGKKERDVFTFLDIVNIYTLFGLSMLVISVHTSLSLEIFIIGLLTYLKTLNFFLKILFGYDVRHKVMFLSLGYTKREYFLKYLLPRNIKSIVSHFLETFSILFLAFIIGKSESIPREIIGIIQLILILTGFGIFFLEKLRVLKRCSH